MGGIRFFFGRRACPIPLIETKMPRLKHLAIGLWLGVWAAAPARPAQAQDEAPSGETKAQLEILLEAIERLEGKPEAFEQAIETLRSRSEQRRENSEGLDPPPSAARLNEAIRRTRALAEETARLAERFKAIEEMLVRIERETARPADSERRRTAENRADSETLARLGRALAELRKEGKPPGIAEKPGLRERVEEAAAKIDPEAAKFFEAKIRPVLLDTCFECHSGRTLKGELSLESRAAMIEGGETGSVLAPGDVEKSRIIQVLRYDDLVVMPPDGKLPDEAIRDWETWVEMGAPWPRTKQVAAPGETEKVETAALGGKNHWAFQPVVNPSPPRVQAEAWVDSPIDRFIVAKLEERGFAPSPRASKATLIRRAYFDLIGLPPTAEQIAAFEAEEGADAFERLVNRLLESPGYGERWARYWLDVARYADTKGYVFAEERRFPYSFTYRDYVIQAFNDDKPYDRFIVEQLAADRLDLGEDKSALAAMGFLTLGRRFLNNVHDIIDDRIDVTTRGLLGLTVQCARCHDHKYDPIAMEDYYALYGVFRSSIEPAESPLIAEPEPSEAYEDYKDEVKRREKEVADYLTGKHVDLLTELRERGGDYLLAAHETAGVESDEEFKTIVGERKLYPEIVRRWQEELKKRAGAEHDPIFAPWLRFAALQGDSFAAESEAIARAVGANRNAERKINRAVAEAFKSEPPKNMGDVAERYGELFAAVDREWGERLRAAAQIAAQNDKAEAPNELPDAEREAVRAVLYDASSPANVPAQYVEKLASVPIRDRLNNLRNALLRTKSTHPGRPARAMVLNDAEKPFDPYVFKRGKPGNKGPQVARRFIALLANEKNEPFSEGSGRLELARAIANRENPLTARVLVNRVWLHHFGTPLVDTPSDFGLRSGAPSHPELLDYLAWRFMEEGWSIKSLHRTIMNSSVYRQSSAERVELAAVDPENRWLGRYSRRRRDFEAMRDSLLAVSGRLDRSEGGPSVDIVSAKDYSPRRSIYGFIERQNLPAIFRTFDFASPDAHSPRRHVTTVPQQALFMMNSRFVADQARSLVARAEVAEKNDPRERIRALNRIALGREPAAAELELGLDFIARQSAEPATPPAPPPVWRYGYGEYDEDVERLLSFEPLPYYRRGSWRGGEEHPDPELDWVMLNRSGGHPGKNASLSAIRRWVAPRAGLVEVSGELKHPADQGDGIIAYIVVRGEEEMGRWAVFNGETEAEATGIEVDRGDTIDFVVACGNGESSDSFSWAPRVRMTEARASAAELGDAKLNWDARADFSGPPEAAPAPLDVWEEYAQVLLASNEFMFVD